ncbi:MAG: flavodoxin-dependent (E)-4-hydroxy-3-methylbut-2-enyl-diphosphate synthase [Oscillospiraceae bacterium]|jgi:(E)-4-hydroxy-3-methylbut-2-enyl-diphosphate synthase|nr:flavodoxin-dependent (E)-4-hydroxy-3-methylbut-2-enyl-diphosphate synthase [Oscillospiraceae bacterium]
MREVKKVKVGNLTFGGDRILIQSMLNAKSGDISGNIRQAQALEEAGCDIIRVAFPAPESAAVLEKLKESVKVPIVADIHFDYKLALRAVEAGADKIRINPGNIGSPEGVKAVAEACWNAGIPIRVGSNAGSLGRELLLKYGKPTPGALVESALNQAKMLEYFGFDNIVLSLKSSDVKDTVAAYRLAAQQTAYPLHIGVTEAGTEYAGTVKSAIGIGSLLVDGIGETVRVSLTADPLKEITAAKTILTALGLSKGVNIISCPTCGRANMDVERIADTLERVLKDTDDNLTVAVMGCAVNGPGEARQADLGVAGAKDSAVLFKDGEVVRKVAYEDVITEIINEIKAIRRLDD